MSARRLDPDELADLEDQRDHLLASLEDLEAEYAAGDLDEVDYTELRDDYTVRASEVLAAIEQRRALLSSAPRPDRRRTVAVTAAVLLFAVVAGVLVARGAGQRGSGPITGAVDTPRAALATCQQASFQDPDGGIDCYAELLDEAPDNVEALTYQGWALIRAERVDEGTANLERAIELDPDYPDARAFRAIAFARAGDVERAAEEIDRFYRSDPPPVAVQVLQSQGLEREVFVLLLDEDTRACWQGAADASADSGPGEDTEGPDDAVAGAFLADLGECLDALLVSQPANVDALVSRAYASVGPDRSGIDAAVDLADRAVLVAPQDPNALLLRTTLAIAQGRFDEAEADLAALDGLARPTASFLFGGPDAAREALMDARSAPATTTPPPGSTPQVPNPDGG